MGPLPVRTLDSRLRRESVQTSPVWSMPNLEVPPHCCVEQGQSWYYPSLLRREGPCRLGRPEHARKAWTGRQDP
eukprot:354827-Chlamydomonas_euryale.AAC.6